jgi:transcriptional regulator with XRE-family HTH domain
MGRIMHVGNLIRQARQTCSVTQVELARRLNCSQTAVAQMEGRESINSETLDKVAAALGMSLEIRFTPKSAS